MKKEFELIQKILEKINNKFKRNTQQLILISRRMDLLQKQINLIQKQINLFDVGGLRKC